MIATTSPVLITDGHGAQGQDTMTSDTPASGSPDSPESAKAAAEALSDESATEASKTDDASGRPPSAGNIPRLAGERAVRRARQRLGWDALSGVSGIVGALLAAAALVVAVLAWLVPNSADPTGPDLKVVSAEISRLQEVAIDPEGQLSFDIGRNNVQDLAIDVHLFNSGGTPVLIETITADVLLNQPLELCPLTGGYLGPDMLYDIRVLADPNALGPVVLQRPFHVAPNSFDRLSLTVGPYGSFLPFVYVVRLHAQLAGSASQIDLGTFSLVNPVSSLGRFYAEAYSGDPAQADCIRNNAVYLRQAMSFGATVAPEVTSLAARFEKAVSRLDRGEPLIAPGDESDPPASRNLPRCEQAGLPTVVGYELRADVTGDNRADILLSQACSTSAAAQELSFFDGADASGTRHSLLGPGDGLHPRGLTEIMSDVSDGVVSVSGLVFRGSETEPSIVTTDTFAWDGTRLSRKGERTCADWLSKEPRPCVL